MDHATMVSEYVDRLLEEKGLAHVDEKVLAEMREDLQERVSERINAEMLAALPEGKVDELNQLLDGNQSNEAVREFFMANVPDVQSVLTSALVNFRSAYLG